MSQLSRLLHHKKMEHTPSDVVLVYSEQSRRKNAAIWVNAAGQDGCDGASGIPGQSGHKGSHGSDGANGSDGGIGGNGTDGTDGGHGSNGQHGQSGSDINLKLSGTVENLSVQGTFMGVLNMPAETIIVCNARGGNGGHGGSGGTNLNIISEIIRLWW
jgi:hypothetical protein